MGFKREKIHRLTWEDDHELAGLEVRVASIPIGEFMDIEAILDRELPPRFKTFGEALDWMYARFGEALVSWNLEDKADQPIPADLEGLMTQDREFVMLVMRDWIEALRTVTRPLPKPSSAGERSAEVSIPMETLSENLAS